MQTIFPWWLMEDLIVILRGNVTGRVIVTFFLVELEIHESCKGKRDEEKRLVLKRGVAVLGSAIS